MRQLGPIQRLLRISREVARTISMFLKPVRTSVFSNSQPMPPAPIMRTAEKVQTSLVRLGHRDASADRARDEAARKVSPLTFLVPHLRGEGHHLCRRPETTAAPAEGALRGMSEGGARFPPDSSFPATPERPAE